MSEPHRMEIRDLAKAEDAVLSADGTPYSDDFVRKVLRIMNSEPEAVFDADEIVQLDTYLNTSGDA